MKDMNPAGRMWHLYKMGGITPAITSMFNAQSAQQMAFIRSVMKEQRKNSLYEVTLDDMESVVFDLETTGFSPYNGDEIISIGAVVMVGDEVKESETFHSYVNPKRSISEDVEQLTGITNRMAADAPDLIEALHDFLDFVKQRVLIAHGSGHDKHFLNSALWKTSKVSLSHRLLDTMMIARWLHPRRPSYCLDSMLETYDIPVTQRHHALEDSLMTARMWSKMVGRIRDRDVSTLGDLYAKLSHY